MNKSSTRSGLMGQYAGFISRAGGIVLDFVIVALIVLALYNLIALPLNMLLNVDPSVCLSGNLSEVREDRRLICSVANLTWLVVTVAAAPVYFIFFYISTGQTIGMYVMGLRVVRLDGRPMSLWRSILRWFGLIVSLIPMGLGFLWILFDDRRQGWMDKLAGTCVVYAWSAEQDEFFLAKFRRAIQRGRRAWATVTGKPAAAVGDPTKHYDLVSIAFPDYDKLDDVLGMIQDGFHRDEFQILNATVLAKGDGDSVSVMGASDLSTGSSALVIPAAAATMPEYETRQSLQGVPDQHFVVAVILEEEYADALIRRVSRMTSALVRRHDLGTSLSEMPKTSPAPAAQQPVDAAWPSAAAAVTPTIAASPHPAPATAAAARSSAASVSVTSAGTRTVAAAAPIAPAAQASVQPPPYANAAFCHDEVATITVNAEALQRKLQQTLREAEALRMSLAGRNAELGRVRAELDALRATTVSVDEWKKVQGQADALGQVLARTMSERMAVQATLDGREQELAAAQQQIATLQATTVSADELQKSQRQVQRSLADGAAVQTALETRTTELDQLRALLNPLQKQLQQAETERVALQAALDKGNADAARTRDQLAALQSTMVSADELAKAKNQVERLQKQLQQVDGERSTVLTALGDRDAAMAELRADLNERNRQVAELRAIQNGLAAAVEGWCSVAAGQVPPARRGAIQAAMAEGIPGRATDTLQNLADLVDIGERYERRLYRAGIGTFWEVAHLADTDLCNCLGLPAQQTAVNLDAVRADALRLAAQTGTAGLIYTGETPDDFAPIHGIDKAFEQRLYDVGIRTYAGLAAATPAQLDAACQARKPLPDYASWIQQAQALAAAGPAATAAQDEGRLQAYTAQVDDLQRQLASIQAEAAAAQSLLAERDGQLARLNTQLDMQQKSGVSQTEMKKLQIEFDALRRELDAAQAARASLQATLDAHTTELAEAKSALARASSLSLESLPAFKLAAAKAAADQGVRLQATPVPQNLADLVQIGTVYEQQLYRCGIGTFWEAAHLADADLDVALQPDALRRANLDYGALRADALRLAGATGTVGLLWTGESPDDFEPIVGIGKVFEQRLYAAGVRSYAALAAATPAQLAAICQARKPLEPDYAGWIRQAQQFISRG